MSRKQSKAEKQQLLIAEQVALQKQSASLKRQLDRNDADLAALVDLNRSLRAVRDALLQSSGASAAGGTSHSLQGELILLDLGEGKLRLAPDGRDVLVRAVTEKDSDNLQLQPVDAEDAEQPEKLSARQQELCIDFLLRRKLRRKLLSRVVRRTHRLAASMDGDGRTLDLPPPPKYGDLRLQCDAAAVRQFRAVWQRQEQALLRIEAVREEESMQNYAATKKDKKEEETKEDEDDDEDDSAEGSKPAEVEKEDEREEAKESKADADETKEDVGDTKMEAEEPAVVEPPAEAAPSSSPVKAEAAQEKEAEKAAEKENDDALAIDYAVLRDFKHVYDKHIETVADDTLPSDAMDTAKYTILEQQPPVEEDHVRIKGGGIGATHHSMSAAEKEMEFKRWQTTLLARIPEQPTYAELGLEHRVFLADERRKRVREKMEEAARQRAEEKEDQDDSEEEEEQDDDETDASIEPSAKEKDKAGKKKKVSKKADASDNDDNDKSIDDDSVDDKMDVDEKSGGIAWKDSDTKVKDPDADVQEEVEKSTAKDKEEEAEKVDKPSGTKGTASAGAKDDAEKSDAMDVDSTDDDAEKKSKKTDDDDDNDDDGSEKSGDEKKHDSDDSSKNSKDEDDDDEKSKANDNEAADDAEKKEASNEEKKKEAEEPHVPKIVRPISLAAVPSFFDQDLRRIRSVQADLLTTSVYNQARQQLEEVVRDYNTALKTSLQLNRKRQDVQQQINGLVHDLSNLAHAFKERHHNQVNQAKHQWNANRIHFEKEKLQKILPSRNGINPTGTHITQAYSAHQDRLGICKEVGMCLADIVDAVDSVAQGTVQNERFSEPFVMPPLPAGFDHEALERGKQVESAKRNELNAVALRCKTSEDERSRAWRKLLKVKGERKMPQQVPTNAGTYRIVLLDASSFNRFPMPQLREAALEALPQPSHLASISSFTPAARQAPIISGDDHSSRYSLSAVRKRIATAENPVAPASTPQKKEGLCQRPPKGMKWDSEHKKWVPAVEK